MSAKATQLHTTTSLLATQYRLNTVLGMANFETVFPLSIPGSAQSAQLIQTENGPVLRLPTDVPNLKSLLHMESLGLVDLLSIR